MIGVFDLDSFIQFSLEVYTATNRRGEYPGMFPARGTNRWEGNLRGGISGIPSAVYLGNGTRLALGCYGALIGSHRRRMDPFRFR